MKQICKCGYEWESKVPNPKECPECHARLGRQKKEKDKENTTD